MATFIRWNETGTGTVDRFLVSMYSTLSSRYYPVNIIKSDLYNIFSMYSEELVDLYDEIQQTYDDLSIDTVRSTPITDRTYSKMYDNFGALIKSSKRYDQYYDTYSTGSMVQSYRHQLRFLMQSFLNGMSVVGLERVGHAFTGIAPLIEQHIKANPRWILTTYTGSVLNVGDGFIIGNVYIPRIGNVFPIDNSTNFSIGDDFSISFSHLGSNTKLSGEDLYYNSLVLTYYTNTNNPIPQYLTTLQDNVDYQTLRVIRADHQIRTSWNNFYTYYRPSEGYDISGSLVGTVPISGMGLPAWVPATLDSISNGFAIHEGGFLYNTGRIHATGSLHTTPVLDLGEKYNYYRWYYDWMVNTREYGDYTIEVRQYPSASIPNSLYYIPIVSVDQSIPPILTEDTGSIRAHWFNTRSQSIYDAHGISTLVATSVPTYETILARDPRRYCFLYDSGITFRQTANSYLNFSNSMSIEMWLKNLYSGTGADAGALEIQRLEGSSYYKVYINSTTKTLHLAMSDGVDSADVDADISPYMDLESPYPHYFAVSYISGSVLFFADGTTLGTASIALPKQLPSMANATQSIALKVGGIGIDEVLLSDDYVDDTVAYNNFMNTRPRYTGVGIPSSSIERYQQAKFTFYGYNVRDIELHQFSMRGILSQSIVKYLNPYYNYPYILPIFKKL